MCAHSHTTQKDQYCVCVIWGKQSALLIQRSELNSENPRNPARLRAYRYDDKDDDGDDVFTDLFLYALEVWMSDNAANTHPSLSAWAGRSTVLHSQDSKNLDRR